MRAICSASSSNAAARRPAAAPCRAPTVAPRPPRPVLVSFLKGPSPRPTSDPAPAPVTLENNGADEQFRTSVDTMLRRAASTLARGPCTCLSCRGGGTLVCTHCKGSGHLTSEAIDRADMLRGVLRRLRAAVGLMHDVPYASSEYMRTNRCLRCHGSGRLQCDRCAGSGRRYPHLAADHWRQCAGQPGADGDACDVA